jgi:pimeloyl-ACP methyl ester carboxylesterase
MRFFEKIRNCAVHKRCLVSSVRSAPADESGGQPPQSRRFARARSSGWSRSGWTAATLAPLARGFAAIVCQRHNPAKIFLAAALFFAGPALADTFDSDGVQIHYLVKGRGEPVILIHGLMASAELNWVWPGIVSRLAASRQVIALDCRGHGESGQPVGDDQYGLKMVDDVVRLLDHLKIRRADIVGYSMGGMITMKLMELHPDRVRSAVVCGMGWVRQNPMPYLKPDHTAITSCIRGFAQFVMTEAALRRIKTPFAVIVGEEDDLEKMYVEPLRKVRPDVPVHLIAGANHFNCVAKPDFWKQLQNCLQQPDANQTR